MATRLEDEMQAAEAEWRERWDRGPERTRWTELPPQVGDAAPEFRMWDHEGRERALSGFWADRPALVLFWRQFGCGCGMARAERLNREYAEYVAAGGNVVIVGQGEPERAAAYRERMNLPCPVLCDPQYHAYEAYGLVEGTRAQLLFDAPPEFLHPTAETTDAFVRSRRDEGRPLVDNPWLLPGEFVVDTDGRIRLAHRYNYCEDFPDPRVHVAAIREASAGSRP